MVETKTTGRRAAVVELDVIGEITAAATERAGGRRASRASESVAAIAPAAPVHANYVGRRFEERSRYGIAPTRQMLVLEEAGSNVIALPGAIAVEPESAEISSNIEFISKLDTGSKKPSRLGFSHKVAAVAAVSGLALAAVAPQFSGSSSDDVNMAVASERTATSAVVDVTAPGSAGLDVERAALTSELNPNVAGEEKLSEVMAASGGKVTAIKSTSGLLDRPVKSNRITSPFGHRNNPTGAGTMIHGGTDYGVACGTEVYASASGTVTVAGWAGHSGNRVMVDHGDGLETGYSHNTKVLVNVGDKVKRGDLIALSGTTGNSTGCHVHFDVIIDGQFKDPAGWL
ncbi:M23 family metallopeptidase [Glutamicibacter protophormiae]|uniref:M23 family metallopeptidase n=1 Tax=Glutamicibacter protophormiae TaxID=37930 RepID=UPI003A90F36E